MKPGDQVGRYVVERVLGQGAVGIVCLATDPVIDRKVALKTLRGDADQANSEELKQRFLREARAAGRLSHPNITTVYDVGQDPASGGVFIAMEYVEGVTLESVIRATRRHDVARAVSLATDLAEALGYAHEQGVVHRDVKPSNIIVNTAGIPKITDFGIARLEASTLTVQGAVLGTPFYMSPEQVDGRRVDGRTDLYALGVILFELLTGTPPFSGRSLLTMIDAIVRQPVPDLTTLRPDIPAKLAQVVRTALAKDPDTRFQTGRELAGALRDIDVRPRQPKSDLTSGATVMGISAATHVGIKGTLRFLTSERTVHIRSGNELLVGRDARADIHLPYPQVSRRHATLSLTDTGVRFTDLASSNGSARNWTRVTGPVELGDGDVLGIGGAIHFLVRCRQRPGAPLSVALLAERHEYLLCRERIALGSDPHDVDLRIADRQVAPLHAFIEASVGPPMLSSVGGDAVVIVDGRPTDRAQLVDQTTFQLGGTWLVWTDGEASPAQRGPTRL